MWAVYPRQPLGSRVAGLTSRRVQLLTCGRPVVSEQTLDAPPIEVPPGRPRPEGHDSTRVDLTELAYRYRWVLTAVGLLIVSLAIVLYARTRPGYDPYGWLVWGKLTIHLAARHERRALVEAAAVPVHGPLRGVRPLRAVAVDGDLGGDLAERADLRLADRLPSDVLAARAPLRLLRRRAVRGRRSCWRCRTRSGTTTTPTTS